MILHYLNKMKRRSNRIPALKTLVILINLTAATTCFAQTVTKTIDCGHYINLSHAQIRQISIDTPDTLPQVFSACMQMGYCQNSNDADCMPKLISLSVISNYVTAKNKINIMKNKIIISGQTFHPKVEPGGTKPVTPSVNPLTPVKPIQPVTPVTPIKPAVPTKPSDNAAFVIGPSTQDGANAGADNKAADPKSGGGGAGGGSGSSDQSSFSLGTGSNKDNRYIGRPTKKKYYSTGITKNYNTSQSAPVTKAPRGDNAALPSEANKPSSMKKNNFFNNINYN